MKNPYNGLVVELPEVHNIGILFGAQRLNKNTYKGTIIGSDKRLYIATFTLNEPKAGLPINYIEYVSYDLEAIFSVLDIKHVLASE